MKLNKTQRSFVQTFFILLDSESFDRLTVNQICQTSDLSRTTFYRYYLDKYDLLNKINNDYIDSIQRFILQRLEKYEITISLLELSKFMAKDSERLLKLMEIHTLESDFINLLRKMLKTTFLQGLKSNKIKIKDQLTSINLDYLADLFVAVSLVFLQHSLNHNITEKEIESLNKLNNKLFLK